MSLNPDAHDPKRANLTALRWDSAWIDPALRRMAEIAAQRAGLSVEAWMERAIRKACGMPEAARPPRRAVAPQPMPASVFPERQHTESQFRQAARPAMMAQQAPPAFDDDIEPLALTQAIDPPVARPAPARRLMPPPLTQPQPRAERQSSGLSVVLAGSIAAVLAILAVMVVRDPTLVTDRIAALTGESDQPAQTVARVTSPAPLSASSSVASHEATPLRVLPRPHQDRTVAMTTLPPPSLETGVTLPPPANVEADATPPAAPAAPAASSPPTAVATAPATAEPQETKPAPKPAKPVPLAPVATASRADDAKPVQMAALPSPNALPALSAAEPQRAEAEQPPAAPAATPTPKQPVAMVAPTSAPSPPAPAPMPAPPKAVQTAPLPAPAPDSAPPQQVAMAPAAAPTPAPPSAQPADNGAGVQAAADVRVASDLQAKVKAGDHVAEYRLGILYALGKGVTRDYDYAAKLLHRSAESGLPEAQYDYGVLCDKGLGVPRDSAEAARWYAKAAQQGHPPAALNLGYAYAEGLGVVRNLPEAARWFRRAAEAGLINAQFNLAYMYEQGAGIAKSPVDAYAWYSVAAEKGDQGAQQAVERIASRMTPRDLQAAKARIKVVKRSIRIQN
ncbi:MAG TPA: tetratricopeptide repeat protein [Stellaceae bacterium]|jgi:localization factor PodJL